MIFYDDRCSLEQRWPPSNAEATDAEVKKRWKRSRTKPAPQEAQQDGYLEFTRGGRLPFSPYRDERLRRAG
jgi:hypothetical protein